MINPESFKGKTWLLVIDKLIIGAIIGGAILFYDSIKTNDERAYLEKKEEIQLLLKQAELNRQFLPIVLDKSKTIKERIYSLISLSQTNSMDALGILSLSESILKESDLNEDLYSWREHPDMRYLENHLKELPPNELIKNFERYLVEFDYSLKGYDNINSDSAKAYLAKSAYVGMVASLVNHSLIEYPSAFKQLNSNEFLSNHFVKLYKLTEIMPEQQALEWADMEIKGLKLIGIIELLGKGKVRDNDIRYLTTVLQNTNSDFENKISIYVFDILRSNGICLKDLSKTALGVMQELKKNLEVRRFRKNKPKKYNPKKELFSSASKYFVWSCFSPQIDSIIEPLILPELINYTDSIKRMENNEMIFTNSFYERELIKSRISSKISSHAREIKASSETKEVLDRLFNINDNVLDTFNIFDLKEEWKNEEWKNKAHNKR